MEHLHSESSRKIYHDNTTDLYLIAARRYAFWFLHETYEENKLFKKEIQEEIKKADEKIKQFDEENQKKLEKLLNYINGKINIMDLSNLYLKKYNIYKICPSSSVGRAPGS